jgi:hypothetical protein
VNVVLVYMSILYLIHHEFGWAYLIGANNEL